MDQKEQDVDKDVKPSITRRLPSLRGPRDLTLGGVRKKTFAPTIPVRKERIKQEPKDGETKSISNKQTRSKRGSRGGRGRGRGRVKQEVIQSHSIFESGPSMEKLGKRPSAFSGSGGGSTKDAIERPTIKKEELDAEYEKIKSEEALESLKGKDSFLSDLKSDDSVFPMSLPMSKASWPPGRQIHKLKTDDSGVSIKQESACLKKKEPGTSNCADIFMNTEGDEVQNSDIIVFQLPDTLPALAPSADTDAEEQGGRQSGMNENQKDSKTVDQNEGQGCTLDCLSEGYIGKLQVLKSGKCRLILGKIVLDLDMGTPTSFHEEIVSIRLPPEGAGDSYLGHMTVLGDVSHKVVCMPDMESLILHEK